ncbi:ATP-binding protein [Deinococcus cellulosilyticus]|uniref:Uncharacterized protein n=1 Tax=Deinococcus cellulosilyticus (strain DSM 18568 / NBRC 106333 / KACC 11606 / 5516J-15) TaxID=1223518 RepID=A0A511MXK8_DEIC1|nr:ATP-binding protein [Deinococcus cellulosilyticus]GEM45313.1 hypothetical protein DC3_09480 [Deinococcus cellulosilyticus NBRC 106333 = KACC 11606]
MSLALQNWLILGSSGSGKTYYLNMLLEEFRSHVRYLVVVNSTRQLQQHCAHHEYVSNADLDKQYSPEMLANLIRAKGSIHFEVAPSKKAKAFLNSLSEAVMSLGVFEAESLQVLVVVDECQNYVSKQCYSEGWNRIETEGRKFGIGVMKATQNITSTGQTAIEPDAVKQVTRLVVFPLSEVNQRRRILEWYPEMTDPGDLKMPDLANGWGPEYLIRDRPTGRADRLTRQPDGSRIPVRIGT